MPIGKRMPGAGLKIALERPGPNIVLKSEHGHDLPW